MKKLSNVLLVSTIIVLVGCGGESNSSIASSGGELELPNTEVGEFVGVYDYYPESVNENACSTDSRIVIVGSNNTCTVELSGLNNGKSISITCHDDGSISVGDGPKSQGGTLQLNGYYFSCIAG